MCRFSNSFHVNLPLDGLSVGRSCPSCPAAAGQRRLVAQGSRTGQQNVFSVNDLGWRRPRKCRRTPDRRRRQTFLSCPHPKGRRVMAFKLPPLPFDKAALEPHISAETLRLSPRQASQGLCRQGQWLGGGEGPRRQEPGRGDRARPRRPATRRCSTTPARSGTTASSGIASRPPARQPSGKLADMIAAASARPRRCSRSSPTRPIGHFASGWAWLVLEGDALKITSLHDADRPVAHDGMKPLFTLDVWEHAYYIDYRNARPKFVEAVLGNSINWDFVAQNLDGGRRSARADQQPCGVNRSEALLSPARPCHRRRDIRRWSWPSVAEAVRAAASGSGWRRRSASAASPPRACRAARRRS